MKPLTTIRDRIFGSPLTEKEKRGQLWPLPESFIVGTSAPKDQLTPQQKAELIYQRAAKNGRADTVRGIVSTIIGTHTAPHGWLYDANEIAFLTEDRVPASVVNTILERIPSKRQVPVSGMHLWSLTLLFGVGSSVWRDVDLSSYDHQPEYLDEFLPPFYIEDFTR